MRKMCDQATTHQKPSFKGLILFGAKGLSARHRRDDGRAGDDAASGRLGGVFA